MQWDDFQFCLLSGPDDLGGGQDGGGGSLLTLSQFTVDKVKRCFHLMWIVNNQQSE